MTEKQKLLATLRNIEIKRLNKKVRKLRKKLKQARDEENRLALRMGDQTEVIVHAYNFLREHDLNEDFKDFVTSSKSRINPRVLQRLVMNLRTSKGKTAKQEDC